MGKVIQNVLQALILLVLLGALGVGIASLITQLNVQNTLNDQLNTPDATIPTSPATPSTPATPVTGSTVKAPKTVPTVVPDKTTADPNVDPEDPETKTTVEKIAIPDPIPIEQGDPRYPAYSGMSELLKTWMNTSINPCNDFYQFTCGAGKKDQGMSFDVSDDAIAESMLGQLTKPASEFKTKPVPVQQMKWFYDSCIDGATNDARAARSKRIFDDMRAANRDFGFPALYPTETTAATPEQLAAFLGYSLGSSGITTLVDVGVDTDWKDPHNAKGGYALLVDQPATLFAPTFYTKLYSQFKNLVVDIIVYKLNSAASLLGIKNLDQKQVNKDAADIAQLDYDLATKYSTDETTRRQYARSYNPYTVDGLQKLAPFLDWETYFNKALVPISKTVDGSFRSLVMEVDKLSMLSADVSSGVLPARTINNYLYYIVLSKNYLPLPETTRKMSAHLNGFRRQKRLINRKIRRDPKRGDPMDIVLEDTQEQEIICQNLASSFLTWASSRVYADANYPTDTDKQLVRDQTNSIIRSILVAFRAQIDLLDWMSPASKKGAYQKVDNLVVNIAYPDWVLDDEKLTDYYKILATTQNEAYLDQVDKLRAFNLYEAFSPLVSGGPADRTDFSGPAAITNAWYQPEANSITFPGGILHAPFYDVNYPAAINYGSLGVIGGHELTHGFDDEGVQWEGTGILDSWMDENSTKAFTKMAQCVVDEYSQFCPLGEGMPCVDGDQTQGENIADNGGIQAAYKAFKAYEALNGPDPLLPGDASHFTADQLFFLSFAQVWCEFPPPPGTELVQILTDPHSPSLYRVLGTIQNIPAFQKAFNCPSGSTYAPKEHCNVWTSEPTSGAPLNERGEPEVPDNDLNIEPVERISPQDMDKYTAYQTALNTFKASANFSEHPCDDFYHYSCGNYPGAKQTMYDLDQAIAVTINDKLNDPDYQATTIAGSTALSKLKTLYTSCKTEAKESTIGKTDYLQPKVLKFRNYINQDVPLIGGTGKIDVTSENLGNVLGYLSFQLGIDTLVTPDVDAYWPDPQAAQPETTNGYQLFLDQPTTYHVRAFYEDGKDGGDNNWDKQKPAYKSAVKTLIEAYAKQDTTAQLPPDYEYMIEAALNLEQVIAIQYSGTDEERRSYLRQWNPTALAMFPDAVDWNKYWSFAPGDAQDWVASKDIVMNEKDKTSALLAYLTKEDTKDDATLVNYLFIRLILANAGLIPDPDEQLATAMQDFAMKDEHTHSRRGRIHRRRHRLPSFAPLDEEDADGVGCADEVGVLADAAGRVYIDARFPTSRDRQQIIDTTLGVMSNIVNAMKGMIIELDWMTEDSKLKALNKASNIHVNVAYPDFILENDKLNAEYEDLVFDADDSYYAMLDKITVYSINHQCKLLKEPKANRGDFLSQTAVVDAWYDPELNSITFPAGILQQPYFDINYPAGLNYGGIGHVAGHELTHGFDDEGVQWDYDGRLNSWMDETSQTGFNNMTLCVIDEYDKFCPLPEDRSPRCTNGVRTQGENIADNGGIHSAWRAYQSHVELNGPDPLFMDRVFSQYTENQLFFRNNAQLWCMQKNYLTESYVSGRLMTDPHALGPYRILGTLQNIPAFRANFNCPLGTTYAPVNHCNVWVPTNMAKPV